MPVGAIDFRRSHVLPASSAETMGAAGGLRIRILLILQVSLVLMVIANLGRIPFLSSGGKEAPVLLNDIFLLGLLGSGTFVALQNRYLRLDRTAFWAIAFVATGGFSALLALHKFDLTLFELAFSLAYLARWVAYFGVYLIVINFVSRANVGGIWRTLETALLIFAGFGILQSAFLPGFAQIIYPDSVAYVDWDIQGRRLVSTFLDPNFAGGFIAIGLLILLAQLATGAKVSRWKLLLLFTALILTISRSSFLALAVGGVVIVAVRGLSRRLLKFGALLLVLLLPALPLIVQYATAFNKFSIDASALARVASWIQAFEIFRDNPIIGVGFNTYGFVRANYGHSAVGASAFTLDGGLIFIAVMTGLFGVCLYGAMIISVLRRCRRIWRSPDHAPGERGLATGIAAATVALVVHSFFLNSLLYPFLMEPVWVLWGLTSVMLTRSPERAPPSPQAARLRAQPSASLVALGLHG